GRKRLPRAQLAQASIFSLPFRDGCFDLVFTCGVLIHIDPAALAHAFSEIHRVTSRYMWLGEYYSPEGVEVPYRGQTAALFKCDFGKRLVEQLPAVTLLEQGFLGRDAGFDDVSWWLFAKGREP